MAEVTDGRQHAEREVLLVVDHEIHLRAVGPEADNVARLAQDGDVAPARSRLQSIEVAALRLEGEGIPTLIEGSALEEEQSARAPSHGVSREAVAPRAARQVVLTRLCLDGRCAEGHQPKEEGHEPCVKKMLGRFHCVYK